MGMMDDFGLEQVEAKQCRDCALRKHDTVVGNVTIPGHSNAFCDAYPKGTAGKPATVLSGKTACEYRTKA